MSYSVGAATTDAILLTQSTPSIASNAMSFGAWVYPTTAFVNGKGIFGTRCPSGSNSSALLRLSSTAGAIEVRANLTSSATQYISSSGVLSLNKWSFVWATFNITVEGHMYSGDLSTPVTEVGYGTSVVGVGTLKPEAAGQASWGNSIQAGAQTNAFTGRVAWGQVYSRMLTLPEIEFLRRNPRSMLPGCVNFLNLDESLVDLSSGGNQGFLSGAVPASPCPALAPRPRRRLFGISGGAAFSAAAYVANYRRRRI